MLKFYLPTLTFSLCIANSRSKMYICNDRLKSDISKCILLRNIG